MFKGVESVTIAVKDIEAAIEQYRGFLGMEPNTRGDNGTMKTAWFDFEATSLELVQDDDPNSPVGRFMTRNGGVGGVYYIALKADDPTKTVAELRGNKVRLVGDPGEGVTVTNQAFIHPAAASGVLMRLVPLDYRPRG